jgi:hypothetical protein
MERRNQLINPGRPRLNVNLDLVLRLRDEENLGWTRGAEQYRERTGQWISRDTFKRRYHEAKATLKSWRDELAEELAQRLKERWDIQ